MNINAQVASGLRWSGIAAISTTIAGLLQLVVLFRFLSPTELGVVAMATVVITFSQLLADVGIGNAVIHRQVLDDVAAASLSWFGFVVGAAIAIALQLVAPLVAARFDNPAVAPVISLAALSFLVSPLATVRQATLERDLRFSIIAVIEGASALAGCSTAVILAASDFGPTAYAGALVAVAITRTAMLTFWGSGPALIGHCSIAALRPFLAFGGWQWAQRLFTFGVGNVDYLFIGAYLGSHELGLYMLAFQLAVAPTSRLNALVGRVAFPWLARSRDDRPQLASRYLLMHEGMSTVNLSLLGLWFGIGPLVVPQFGGPEWQGIGPLIGLMAVLAAGRALAGTVSPLLLATGSTRLGFWWSVLICTIQTPSMWAAAAYGQSALTVAWWFCGLQWLYLMLTYILLIRPMLGPYLAAYVRSSLVPVMVAIVGAGVTTAIGRWQAPMDLLLSLQLLAGSLMLVLVIRLCRRRLLTEFRILLMAKYRPESND